MPVAIPALPAIWLASIASNVAVRLGDIGSSRLMTEHAYLGKRAGHDSSATRCGPNLYSMASSATPGAFSSGPPVVIRHAMRRDPVPPPGKVTANRMPPRPATASNQLDGRVGNV